MSQNESIAALGYALESTSDAHLLAPLLAAVGLEVPQEPSDYVIARTRAGGLAACVGWTRVVGGAVVHSLAVAPSSRGTGVGASLLATALAHIMDAAAVEAIYLLSPQAARRFFESFGFAQTGLDDLSEAAREHASFSAPQDRPHHVVMARHYKLGPRGLDKCAFRLLENRTDDAALPMGSVLFFEQSGQLLEARYRGGAIARGHILGRVDAEHVRYLWHAYSVEDELLNGGGHWRISSLDDGRRELRELGETHETLLVMREV